jgi:hypothetical protein
MICYSLDIEITCQFRTGCVLSVLGSVLRAKLSSILGEPK